MTPSTRNSTWLREELLHLLSLSGTLAGLCITGVALRTKRDALALALEKIADVLFLLALTGMVASGLIMVYTVW